MKRKASLVVWLVLVLSSAAVAAAQTQGTLRVEGLSPYDSAVPGQILELRVEGISAQPPAMPSADDMRIQITQAGTTLDAKARAASTMLIREARDGAAGGDGVEMKTYVAVSFVVPRGLRPGEAEVVLQYRQRRSNPVRLNVVERPLRPTVGGPSVLTIAPASLPAPPRRGTPVGNLGFRFERGAKAELHVRPLADPDDPDAAVLVRFKQAGAFHEAAARVVHQERKTEQTPNGGVRFLPARDYLEIDVPDTLAPSEAEMEVRVRAGGQTGEPITLPVLITDSTRVAESPKEVAPRVLSVAPRRVGAGQALMISVDRRLTLDPDPSQAVVVVEQGGESYTLRPEMNSALRDPNRSPDAPVLLIARPGRRLLGAAQVRVVNPARGEQGLASEPSGVEIVDETLPPEILSAGESTRAELAPLVRMYEAQREAGRPFPDYDPSARYVTIRASGLDYNPNYTRIRMRQEGRPAVTLTYSDYSLYSAGTLIVRVPAELGAGTTTVTVENRGARGYSTPAVKTFELRPRQ